MQFLTTLLEVWLWEVTLMFDKKAWLTVCSLILPSFFFLPSCTCLCPLVHSGGDCWPFKQGKRLLANPTTCFLLLLCVSMHPYTQDFCFLFLFKRPGRNKQAFFSQGLHQCPLHGQVLGPWCCRLDPFWIGRPFYIPGYVASVVATNANNLYRGNTVFVLFSLKSPGNHTASSYKTATPKCTTRLFMPFIHPLKGGQIHKSQTARSKDDFMRAEMYFIFPHPSQKEQISKSVFLSALAKSVMGLSSQCFDIE